MGETLYIERVDIGAFGGISQKSISFGTGINLIKAPNESGKSTLAAALLFAFYGFKGRSTAISDNPKKMYMPWSGAGASVAVTVGGSRRLRIERSVQGTKEQAVCTDLLTGKPLYTGLCFGEELLGISAETFEKTLFFSTLAPPESKDTELASALQNLLFSADEQIGTERALKALAAHKNALKGRTAGSGELPRLEMEEQRLEEKLHREKGAIEELNALEAAAMQTEKAAAERAELSRVLEAEKQNLEKYRAALALLEYEALKEKAALALAELEKAPYKDKSFEDIESCRALRDEKNMAEKRLEDAKQEYARAQAAVPAEPVDEDMLTGAFRKYKGLKTAALVLLAAGILVCGIGVALTFLLTQKLTAYALAGLGLLLAVLAACLFAAAAGSVKKVGLKTAAELKTAVEGLPAARRERESLKAQAESAAIRVQQAEAEYENAKRAFSSRVPSETDEEIDRMYTGFIAASGLRAESNAADSAVSCFEAINDIEELRELAKGAVKPQKPREQIETEYKFAMQSAAGLKDKLNGIKSKIEVIKAAGNDPSETESALLWTRAQLNARRAEYNALETAIEELSAASNEMRASISPRIASMAGGYLSAATGGKYGKIELDTRLYMSYESESGLKSAEHLSAGTRETAYLCLRLALIKLIYGDKNIPMFLDDAFAHTDNARLLGLLRLLKESGNQVIISSCTDREEKALTTVGAEYENISL